MVARLSSLLGALGLAVAVPSFVLAPESAPATASHTVEVDPDAAKTCGMCHTEFYEEWSHGLHAEAWTDPIYQESLKSKRKPQNCHGCHIPDDVHKRLGKKPKPRDSHLDEGVTCVSCHKSTASGDAIMGPFGAQTDAHPTAKNPAFTGAGSNHLCASCHDTKIRPVLPVARDHKAYREALGDKAKNCVECHMPAVTRHLSVSMVTGKPVGEERETRRHKILGPGDVEFLAKGFEMGARAADGNVIVSIKNLAGHRIPGLTLREFHIAVRQLGKGSDALSEDEIVLSHENVVQALETREFTFAHAEGATEVELQFDHVLQGKVIATVITQKIGL